MNSIPISKPEKFQFQSDFRVWLGQFELLCSLAKLDDDRKAIYLLANLDIGIYEATISGVPQEDQKNFKKISDFLLSRYSKQDSYLDRIEFFRSIYTGSAEEYGATLQRLLDNFQRTGSREELLVAKFIATAPGKAATELRLRRPTSLSECIRIVNSMTQEGPTNCSTASIGRKRKEERGVKTTETCFRCGSSNHKANQMQCPARSVQCNQCGKTGHYARVCKQITKVTTATFNLSNVNEEPGSIKNRIPRPMTDVLLMGRSGKQVKINMLIDTGSEISVIPDIVASKYFGREIRPIKNIKCTNFDASPIAMSGWIPKVETTFKGRSEKVDFLVSQATTAILGMDAIAALKISITPNISSIERTQIRNTNNKMETLDTIKNYRVAIQLRDEAPKTPVLTRSVLR